VIIPAAHLKHNRCCKVCAEQTGTSTTRRTDLHDYYQTSTWRLRCYLCGFAQFWIQFIKNITCKWV